MIRAVLDTNVVVSAHLSTEGAPRLILDLALGGFFRCYISEELFREYDEVLRRPVFQLDPREVALSIRLMRRSFVVVKPKKKLHVAADPEDDKVLECALEARADYVVTGNVRDFPQRFQDIRVVTSRYFLTILASQ